MGQPHGAGTKVEQRNIEWLPDVLREVMQLLLYSRETPLLLLTLTTNYSGSQGTGKELVRKQTADSLS
jgi:hypothetical protein